MSVCPVQEKRIWLWSFKKRIFFSFSFFVSVGWNHRARIFSSNPVLSSRTGVGIEMSLKQLYADLDINQTTFTATLTYSLLPRIHYTHIYERITIISTAALFSVIDASIWSPNDLFSPQSKALIILHRLFSTFLWHSEKLIPCVY